MDYRIPTGDDYLDKLLLELTTLIYDKGLDSIDVLAFIEANANNTFVNPDTNMMFTFREFATGISQIISGISIEQEPDPADWWKSH